MGTTEHDFFFSELILPLTFHDGAFSQLIFWLHDIWVLQRG